MTATWKRVFDFNLQISAQCPTQALVIKRLIGSYALQKTWWCHSAYTQLRIADNLLARLSHVGALHNLLHRSMKVWIDNFTGIRKLTLILIRGFFGAILAYQLGVFLWGTSLVLGSARIYVNPGEFIAPALVTFATWLFARQKKQAILFLRHFGDEQANQAHMC